jgi:hypothetical protein
MLIVVRQQPQVIDDNMKGGEPSSLLLYYVYE